MTAGEADRRTEKSESPREGRRRNRREYRVGASKVTARGGHTGAENALWMEAVVERENMKRADQRVVRNRGAAGVDEMLVEQMGPYLKEHWERIKKELLEDRYQPQPVRGVEIEKPGGGMRQLGIPTVVDRLIQQALQQVLSPQFDPDFSEWRYGFRPGRSAHQAVLQARR